MYQKAIGGPVMACLMALLGIVSGLLGNAGEGERVSVYALLFTLRHALYLFALLLLMALP